MKRIGITQRVQENTTYPERRDCLDQRWMPFCEAVGIIPVPLFNTAFRPIHYLQTLDLDGFVLSGGNDIGAQPPEGAPERDEFETVVVDFAVKTGLPVIGVCRGMQFLQSWSKGRLSTVEGHVATRHELSRASGWAFPSEVNSYHGTGILRDDLVAPFEAIAWAGDGSIEAMWDEQRRLLGIMWHPEREDEPQQEDLAVFRKLLVQ